MKQQWMQLITLMTTKKMSKIKYKEINTLADLRLAKKQLKNKMSNADKNTQEGFLYKTFNNLVNKVEDNSNIISSPIGNGVNTALSFISGQATQRFKMGTTGKTILSLAVIVAAPIIAKKIQEYVDEKF